MKWLTGYMSPMADSNRLALTAPGQEIPFHCGQRLELLLDGCWQRGWVEYSDSLGWYFTDAHRNLRLLVGDEVRVWDGREWPRAAQDRDFERER
ncbi:MAG TPA: DUF5348 domain-containing protein [Symbiobacteriaceae bacterium]|nr:DUF5348 domain-containing protein [Symbiobacteriaceae bacterium]